MSFSRVFVQREIETTLTRIWTPVTDSISYALLIPPKVSLHVVIPTIICNRCKKMSIPTHNTQAMGWCNILWIMKYNDIHVLKKSTDFFKSEKKILFIIIYFYFFILGRWQIISFLLRNGSHIPGGIKANNPWSSCLFFSIFKDFKSPHLYKNWSFDFF